VLVGSLLGGALACLAGCAAVTGLDSIQECSTCFDDGGRTQDGTVGADVAGDATPGTDSSPDSSPDTSVDHADAAQDAANLDAPADAPTDGPGLGDGSSDAPPPDAHGDAAEAGNSCNPTTCLGGCCQGVNCIAGTMDTACGQTGGACLNCATLGDTCIGGACQAPSSNCPTTCSGCCDTNNACHATYTAKYCPTSDGGTFKAGLGCEDCVAEGYPFCIQDFVVYVCSPIP
jgi:hypothetical protein